MNRQLVFDASLLMSLLLVLGVVSVVDRFVPAPDRVEEGGTRRRSLLQPDSIYGLRDLAKEDREKVIEDLGGTKRSEKAAAAGLAWLARHQAKDGCWCNRYLGHGPECVCERENPCRGQGDDFAKAQTGLALLAFQAGGHFYFNDREYSEHVRNGLDWLVENQDANGGLHRSNRDAYHYYMYEHGIATFALAEACAVAVAKKQEPAKAYLDAAKRAIAYIEDQQHDDGGWRYTSNKIAPSDTSVTGWQVLALKSAKEAGIEVKPECLEKVRRFLVSCETGSNGRTGYQGGNVLTDATTGVGMLVHQFLLNTPESDLVLDASKYLSGVAERSWGQSRVPQPDYYLWYNCTLAMHRVGGPDWDRWNNVVRDSVIDLQEGEQAGCARGSWSPNSKWGNGGRIYTTALAVLTLEVYYRYARQVKE